MAKLPNNKHDSYLRSVLSDMEVAAVYFKTVLPAHLVERLDFSTLKLTPNSYVSDELEQSMSDVVYSCGFKGGGSLAVEIALLIEHKSYYDKYALLQIGGYLFSGYRQQLKQEKKKKNLTPIIPILFYHGEEKWDYRTLENLFGDEYAEFFDYIPNFSYIYNNLRDTADGELMALQHGFLTTSLLLLKHTFDSAWIQGNVDMLLLVGLSQGEESRHRSMLLYLFDRMEFDEEQIMEKIKEFPKDIKEKIMSTYDLLIEKGRKEERSKAEAEKLAEKRESVIKMLRNGFDMKLISDIIGLPIKEIEKLK